ncbi:MAG: hypothetical protein PHD82_12895 [Candidatus Riflebacteria bacterium]|nr:hypothetical protein [Candidatus Riflebacteria bacterium]
MSIRETNNFEEAAVQYLSHPDCLRLALDIYELVPMVKEEILLRFWKKVASELKDTVCAKPGWEIEPLVEIELRELKNLCGVKVCQKSLEEIDFYRLYFKVQFEADEIFIGIGFNSKWEGKAAYPQSLTETVKALEARKWSTTENKCWWPALKVTEYKPLEKNTLLKFAADDSAAESIAEILISIFNEFHSKIEQANQELAKIKFEKKSA